MLRPDFERESTETGLSQRPPAFGKAAERHGWEKINIILRLRGLTQIFLWDFKIHII